MAERGFRLVAQVVLDRGFEDVLERTLAAERAGFAAVLVPDHFYTGEARISGEGIGESWTSVAALAARTERIRVGGAVMCNLFRHPCLTAQIAATVDQISSGRLELGLGAGWMEEEFRRTGLPFPRPGVRIRMLAEALRIVLPALEERRSASRESSTRSVSSRCDRRPFRAPGRRSTSEAAGIGSYVSLVVTPRSFR